MLPNPMHEMTVEDLPNEELQYIAQVCGLHVAISLLESLPGQSFVVPQLGYQRLVDAATKNGRPNGPYQATDFASPTWRFIAERCGNEIVVSLFKHAGNIVVTIPKHPFNRLYLRYIKRHYDPQQRNAMEVAIALGITRSFFFALLHESPRCRRAKPEDPRQMRLV